jgi:chromosome segregation ATPase
MPGESQQIPGNTADPSVRSSEAIRTAVNAERDYVNGQVSILQARLNGMDEATKVLHETVTRTPTDIQQAVGHLKELHNERFESVATQFKERDTRSERESRDNKVAVDAAFAAQKEAASEQNKSNTLAISKSEEATKETLATLAELFRTEIAALAARNDDLKDRLVTLDLKINTIQSVKQGEGEQRATTTGNFNNVGTLVSVVSAIFVIFTVLIANHVFG